MPCYLQIALVVMSIGCRPPTVTAGSEERCVVNVSVSCPFSNVGEVIYTLASRDPQVLCILSRPWSVCTHFAEKTSEIQRGALLPPSH